MTIEINHIQIHEGLHTLTIKRNSEQLKYCDAILFRSNELSTKDDARYAIGIDNNWDKFGLNEYIKTDFFCCIFFFFGFLFFFLFFSYIFFYLFDFFVKNFYIVFFFIILCVSLVSYEICVKLKLFFSGK